MALKGLAPDKQYEVEFVDEDYRSTSKVMAGRKLLGRLELVCPKKESSVLVRCRVSPRLLALR